jgi:hypothetical protein
MREVLTASIPKNADKTYVDAIVGRTLGEVTVEDLIQASYSVTSSDASYEELAVLPLREVYLAAEEE